MSWRAGGKASTSAERQGPHGGRKGSEPGGGEGKGSGAHHMRCVLPPGGAVSLGCLCSRFGVSLVAIILASWEALKPWL